MEPVTPPLSPPPRLGTFLMQHKEASDDQGMFCLPQDSGHQESKNIWKLSLESPKNEIPPENQLPHFIFQVLCWFQGGYEYLATICNDKEFIGTLTHPESSTLSVATRITPVPMGIPRSPSLSTTISANRTASRKCKNSFDPNTDRSRTTTQGEGCRRTPLASSKQTGRQWKSFDPLSPRSSERQFLV